MGNGEGERNRAGEEFEEGEDEVVTLQSLIETLRLFCRASPETADMSIFQIFNISGSSSSSSGVGGGRSAEKATICWKDIQMMLLNLPILGFTMSQNHECIDDLNREQR